MKVESIKTYLQRKQQSKTTLQTSKQVYQEILDQYVSSVQQGDWTEEDFICWLKLKIDRCKRALK